MNSEKAIFESIKNQIHGILPNASVFLFGSRANNTVHDESDWDILILEQSVVDRKIKRSIHDALYPVSLKIGAFINMVLANEKEWNENPSYYSLRLSISRKPVLS